MDTNIQRDHISTFIIGKLAELAEGPELDLEITTSTNLQEVGLDSIRMVKLIVELEENYSIVFEDEEMLEDNFRTIEQISENILGKLSGGV